MKKIITIALLAGILNMNCGTLVTLAKEDTTPKAPHEFKSMVKKDKKYDPSYKYEYTNMDWWNRFNDSILTGYINKAIENNYDLKAASLAVQEYYQQTRAQFANELPQIGAGFFPGYAKMPGTTDSDWSFAVPGFASYEVDIFLKNRDKTKSVKKLYEGSKFDERAAYIAIASAVGTTYLNIVNLDKTIEIQQQIVDIRKNIYELMQLSNQEGLVSTADVVRANKEYVEGMTSLVDLTKQRDKLLNQLCVLIGESPENASSLQRASFDSLNCDVTVPESIATEVIVQRPDYLKAEKMVEKAGIDVRVARKEFLPSINLGGLLFFNANDLGSVFTTRNALMALGGGLFWPLFTGGSRMANLKIRKYSYERVLQQYYKTNLTAIQEVNDALLCVKMDKDKLDKVQKQRDLEAKDFAYSEAKFNQGTISKLDLIQKQENLLDMDKTLAQNKVEFMVDAIGLYKATGSKI